MAYELLLSRINEAWDAKSAKEGKKISERQVCLRAEIGIKTLYSLRKGHAPKAEALARMADYFGTPRDYFLSAAAVGTAQPDLQARRVLEAVYVKGAVQAGVWKAAIEWDADDWYAIQPPRSRRHPDKERYGLEVRGTSMNRHYPEGTVILCIKFFDLEREPRTGDHVVVYRRDSKTGDFEATVKEYELDGQGRHILWPRSYDPEFQTPIILGSGDLRIAGQGSPDASFVDAGSGYHGAGLDDVELWSLVTASYTERSE